MNPQFFKRLLNARTMTCPRMTLNGSYLSYESNHIREIWNPDTDEDRDDTGTFYIASCSTRTLCYKGMVLCNNLDTYYEDLNDPRTESAFALIHQRFSTNTFPSWKLAQPFRYLCHNGEINTLRGNINWMAAENQRCRQLSLERTSKSFGR